MSDATVSVVGYGRAATERLSAALAAAKSDDPLAPVTVIVGSNLAGLSLRRVLALDDDRVASERAGAPGLINVAFVTLYRLAEMLGERTVAASGRRPLTNTVLAGAVRAQLAADPGWFSAVRGHQATESALARVYAELSHARPATLDRISSSDSTRAAAVVAAVRGIAGRLTSTFDEDDLATAAMSAVASTTEAAALGRIIWYLPQPTTPAMIDLMRAVADAVPLSVVVGLTGDSDADQPVHTLMTRVGLEAGAPPSPPPSATQIVSASDPDEEVRAVVRGILAHARQGVRLDRMAVLYPATRPYARIVHEQLVAAAIPHNGPGVSTVAELAAGRALLGALALHDDGFTRHDVISLVATAPVRHAGRAADAARWDLISRRAGVLEGADDWAAKLIRHADALRAQLRDADDWPPGRRVAVEHELRDTEELRTFVAGLATVLAPRPASSSWHATSAWAGDVLAQLIGDAGEWYSWPDAERAAAEAVERSLLRLAALDDLEPLPGLDVFTRALATELEEPAGREGRFGEGVAFGSIEYALGLDFDVVFLVGMAEGMCPTTRREDSLLPDAERALAVEGELELRSHRTNDDHRGYLAALASGRSERVLVHPRGDHRNGRTRLPSRWLLDTASAMTGKRVYSSDYHDVVDPAITHVSSYAGAAHEAAATAANIRDFDVATLLAHVNSGRNLTDHHLAQEPGLRAALDAQLARSSSDFTRWDGHVGPGGMGDERLWSASSLETWTSCPFQFFLANVLGAGRVERPERQLEISARDRGSLVHEVLERFIGELIESPGSLPAPGAPWTSAQRARLASIAEETFTAYEARGLTGKPLLWQIHRQAIREDLVWFLECDEEFRAEQASTPVRVEMEFGAGSEPPAEVKLADGRTLRFRGKVDRVDRRDDGSLVVVDYKSGGSASYEELADDPVAGGSHLQLPIYLAAARQLLGREHPTDAAYFWFTRADARETQIGYPLTPARRDRFDDVLTSIVGTISDGRFPADPGADNWFYGTNENCRFCDFDDLCPTERLAQSEAKIDAPELEAYVELTGTEFVLDAGSDE